MRSELVTKARGEEMTEFRKHGVYRKVPIEKAWTITGGSEQVEQKLKDVGWNGIDVVVSAGFHLDNQGKITDSQLFLSGFMDVGRIQAATIFGDSFQESDYVKMESVDIQICVLR